jgi:hypothetical protein
LLSVEEEEAMNIALACAKNYSWAVGCDTNTFAFKSFNVTGAMMIETVFRSSLVADTPRNDDLLMLYPMLHVWVSLDKFYPGNVYGFNVYVWADTGDIAHIQERISTMDPPPELVVTVDDVANPPSAHAPALEAQLGIFTWFVPSVLVVVVLMATRIWFIRKKTSSLRRFFTIGVLLGLLMLPLLLAPIAAVSAAYPFGRATIWGSESKGAGEYPNSWRKHYNEVNKQNSKSGNHHPPFLSLGLVKKSCLKIFLPLNFAAA